MKIWDWAAELSARIAWADVLVAVGIMALFLLLSRAITKFVFSFANKMYKPSAKAVMWTQAFERPVRVFCVVLGIYLAAKYLMPLQWEAAIAIDRVFRSVLIILIGWGIYILSAQSSVLLEGISRRINLDASSMLIPFLSKTLRFIVVLLTITLVGSEWGFSINGLVAGMGLGSLAVALAAKETLGNIFGGVVIIMEKPFSKGDWILTPTVEGVVEDITFRSTQIRTFADALVTVPNATLANEPITNWSRMGRRRITFTLGAALDSDRERLSAAIARLEKLLDDNDHIDPNTIVVKFTDFNASSLGILFYFFTKTTVWSEYLKVREEINFAILRVLEEEGIRLAYPSQRIFLEETAAVGERARV